MKQHYLCQAWAKRAFLFLLVLTLKTQAASTSILDDTSSITLHVINQPIENIFKLIEKQTGLTFYYGRSILDGSVPASVSVNKATLAQVMEVLLKGKNVSWKVKDKGVVLSKTAQATEKATTGIVGDTVPRIKVSGVVTDVKGNVIPGASVSLKGQARGQGTDASGRFSFADVPANGVLIFSSLGFDSRQVKIGGKNELRITLDSAIREIQAVEVVSTGYQSLPRERVNGSFVQLDNALINRTVSTDILDRILNVTSSLRKGVGPNDLTIRGISTISGDKLPLFVVDGFVYEEPQDPVRGLVISNLNPNDIESITILRDAAAASIWGARSGNGVIVITTKRGNYNRKMSVQLNTNLNLIEKPRLAKYRLMSSADAVEFEKMQFAKGTYDLYDDLFPAYQYFPVQPQAIEVMLAQRRGDLTAAEADAKLQALSSHDVRSDLSKYLLQTAVNQQYNVNVSGGSDRVSYYGSIGYDKNRANIKGNSRDRITLRMENAFKPLKGLELRTFISYTQGSSKNNGTDFSPLIASGAARNVSPYTFLADDNGNPLPVPVPNRYRSAYLDTASYPGLLDWHYRPVEEINLKDNLTKNSVTRVGGTLRYMILDGLDIEFKGQYENGTDYASLYSSQQAYAVRDLINTYMSVDPNGRPVYNVPLGGMVDYANSRVINWNTRVQVNYNKTWENHAINALAAYETSEYKTEFDQNRKYGYNPLNEQFSTSMDFNSNYPMRPEGHSSSGKIPNQAASGGTLRRTISYLGNVGYFYKGRYSITLSGRVDASNMLGSNANDRATPLWSASLGWDISKENFYHLDALPYLKFRASYGFNGSLNNKATPLPTAKLNLPNYQYHDEIYLQLYTPPNPGLTWEKVKIVNMGVDFQVKNRRVGGSFEYYTKRGLNLIGLQKVEATRGVTEYTTNFASMKGSGFDITLTTIPIKSRFVWENNFNFSSNTDKVTNVYTQIPPTALDLMTGGIAVIGQPLNTLYSFPSAGLDPKDGMPRGWLNGEITDFNTYLQKVEIKDIRNHGSMAPKFFGNMINTFTYAGVSLSFNISYLLKYSYRRTSVNYYQLFSNWSTHSDYALRWKKTGDELKTTVPALPDAPDQSVPFYQYSSDLVERGDHIRLQDLRVAYAFNNSLLKKIRLSSASVYANATNLGILWRANKSGTDPFYGDNSAQPPQRTVAVGLTIGF